MSHSILGEELIFRGILLPKMNGVFGKLDFIANGVLFTIYHLHVPWEWPSNLLVNWIYAWVAKRFKPRWKPPKPGNGSDLQAWKICSPISRIEDALV